MKITEPKTPYVRYDAETDTFEGGESISYPYCLCLLLITPHTTLASPAHHGRPGRMHTSRHPYTRSGQPCHQPDVLCRSRCVAE